MRKDQNMRGVLMTFCIGGVLLGPVQTAVADACLEAFVQAWTKPRPATGFVKIHITSQIAGQKPTMNYNISDLATGDWLTQMIDPPNMPWSMALGKSMYVSNDKGKSWRKDRDLEEAHSLEAVRKQVAENMKTAKNAKCGTEDLNGVPHATVEAEYIAQGNIFMNDKSWLHPQTNHIVKSESVMRQGKFEIKNIQIVEYLTEFTFPKP
jgi:hypothetical protein